MINTISETIKYLIVGFLTTLINLLTFKILFSKLNNNFPEFRFNWFLAEVPAFIIAVLFAFFMDKYFVFKKNRTNIFETIQEMFNFFMMRIISELVNIFGLFILINICNLDEFLSKLGLSIVVVILNYLFSKFIIFRK